MGIHPLGFLEVSPLLIEGGCGLSWMAAAVY